MLVSNIISISSIVIQACKSESSTEDDRPLVGPGGADFVVPALREHRSDARAEGARDDE